MSDKRPEPYVGKNPGDIIKSTDWNELQVQAKEEIRSHQHKGGDNGALIPRKGIEEKAIDGSRIDPEASVTIKELTLKELTLQKGVKIDEFSGDAALPGNSDSVVPTQKAVREYIDRVVVDTTTIAPPGAIMAFLRDSEPNGWLVCDGRAVSRTTYSRLFSLLGTKYGAGDNATTFNLPDLRNCFLRGAYNNQGTNDINSSAILFDERVSLKGKHKAKRISKLSPTESANEVFLDSVDDIQTNQRVYLRRLPSSDSNIGGLTDGATYYVYSINPTNKSVKLSTSPITNPSSQVISISYVDPVIGWDLVFPYYYIESIDFSNTGATSNTIKINRNDLDNFTKKCDIELDTQLVFRTANTVPGGLNYRRVYYVVQFPVPDDKTRFRISATKGGTVLDLTDANIVGTYFEIYDQSVGSFQNSASLIFSHKHNYPDRYSDSILYYNMGTTYEGKGGGHRDETRTTDSPSYGDDMERDLLSYSESRPMNVTVLYCIKY